MFEDNFAEQLSTLIGRNIQLATDSELYEGILISIANDIVQLSETVVGYERQVRNIFTTIDNINFVRVSPNELL
jgi:hypothetical protein